MLVVQTLSYKHGPKVPTQLFEFCYPQTKGALIWNEQKD